MTDCKICTIKISILKIHLKKIHSITLQNYVAKYTLGMSEDYVPTCLNKDCTNPVKFEENHRKFRTFCSNSCKNLYFMKQPKYKEAVGRTFKKLWEADEFRAKKIVEATIRTKERMSDPEYKSYIITKWHEGANRPEIKEANRQRLIVRNKTLEARAISSQTGRKNNQNPELRRKIGLGYTSKKGYHFSTKMQKSLYYRSSYELKAMEIFDIDYSVIGYYSEAINIPYINLKGTESLFYPDFIVEYYTGSREIIEIKPKFMLKDPLNLLKFAAAKEYCKANNMNFSIWTQCELGI